MAWATNVVTVFVGAIHFYHLERAAQTMVLAYSTGQPLSILSDELAEATAVGWEEYRGMGDAHFAFLKPESDAADPSYAT